MSVLVLTTVRRGAREGEAHGAIYLLDLDGRRGAHAVDWTRPAIDWRGAGGDRGLRGVTVQGERVWVAASGELLEFAPDFRLQGSHRTSYLGHAQALATFEGRLYVASSAYDSVLSFDLETRRFDWGLHLVDDASGLRAMPFDPAGAVGPLPQNRLHLNSLHCDERGLCIGGRRTRGLLHFDGKRIHRLVTLPEDVRDARPWRDGVLFNDSARGVARFLTPQRNRVFQVPRYPESALTGTEVEARVAQPGFARGLCVVGESRFAGGSSPLTVTLHDIESMQTTLSINLDTDVRHAVHSLAPWPFDTPGD